MVPGGVGEIQPRRTQSAQRRYEEKLPVLKASPLEMAYNRHDKWGWEGNFYGVHKVFINALAEYLAQRQKHD